MLPVQNRRNHFSWLVVKWGRAMQKVLSRLTVWSVIVLLVGAGLCRSASSAPARPTLAVAGSPTFVGERPLFTGMVGTSTSRPARFQKRTSVGWRTVKVLRSSARGAVQVRGPVLRKATTFRLLVPRSGQHRQMTSKSLRIRPAKQGARLSLPPSAVAGQSLRVAVAVRPVKNRRIVRLQVRRSGRWVNVLSARQNSQGRASMTLVAPTAGRYVYRVRFVPNGKSKVLHSRSAALVVRQAHTRLVPPDSKSRAVRPEGSFPQISADGRWMTYVAPGRIAGTGRTSSSIYLTEVSTGTTTLVSSSRSGGSPNANSTAPDISADGRYITYQTYATDVVGGDSTSDSDILRFDRVLGTTTRISFVAYLGAPDGDATAPTISGDGRFVAFSAVGLRSVGLHTGTGPWIYLYDTVAKTTEVIGFAQSTGTALSGSFAPDISPDGKTVVFQTTAVGRPPGERSGKFETYAWNSGSKQLRRLSIGVNGAHPNDDSFAPSVSADGRFVTFASDASNLVAGDSGGKRDVFVHNISANTTYRVSQTRSGIGGNGMSDSPQFSDDGSVIVFESTSSNVVAGDTNSARDVFAFDARHRSVSRVSSRFDGGQTSRASHSPTVSANGRFVGFVSNAPLIVPQRNPRFSEVYLRDRSR